MKTLQVIALALAPACACCSRPSASPAIVAEPSPVEASREGSTGGVDPDAGLGSSDGGIRWLATRVEAAGLTLGDFAVASPPDSEHAKGVIAALGWRGLGDDVFVVAIDVDTAREMGRTQIGPTDPEGSVKIAATPYGALVAVQGNAALELVWLDRGRSPSARRALRGLGVDSRYDLRGLAVFDDRIVLASGGDDSVDVRLLDAKGNLLSTHACHGGLFRPGGATLVRMGDEVVVANMLVNHRDELPVCAGHLHGAPRWRDVSYKDGRIELRGGAAYVATGDGPLKKLDENLRATGPEPGPVEATHGPCEGLTGTAPWQEQTIENVGVVHMVSCCGDRSPGGLFICLPRSSAQ
jgi:hypothetical protein